MKKIKWVFVLIVGVLAVSRFMKSRNPVIPARDVATWQERLRSRTEGMVRYQPGAELSKNEEPTAGRRKKVQDQLTQLQRKFNEQRGIK